MRIIGIVVLITATAGLCLAAPVDNDVSEDDYEYDHAVGDDSSSMYQHMIEPDWHTLPKEFFGPEYVWDTKGFPRRRGESQVRKEEASSVATLPKRHNKQKLS
jgi:hypothetical protein